MLKKLYHLFIPHALNNHRSKILHNASLLLIVLFLFCASLVFVVVHRAKPNILGISYSISVDDLLRITNADRQSNGLPALSLNRELTNAAKAKADNMFANNYWAHFAPDGTSPWFFIKQAGYDYSYAGENLAKGFTSTTDIVQAWINSPSHRENMLSNKYKDVGFAIEEGNLLGEDTVLVVEEFAAPTTPVVVDNNAAQVANETAPLAQTPSAGSSADQVSGTVPVKTPQKVILGDANKIVTVTKNASPSFLNTGSIHISPIFDFSYQAKILALILLAIIAGALLIDFVVIEKKKIPRLVGHNLDHLMLIAFAIIVILLEKAGGIL